jgi:hypothetical protein
MTPKIDILALAGGVAADAAASTYRAPALHAVGSAEQLVQGGGGHSGSDRNWYYYFLQGE